MVFTEILDNFIKILENVPGNLKGMCMTLLYFLSTIDIALTVYKNINNPDFNYINWAKMKILNVGFIIFAIKSYEWFLNMVKDFFLSIGAKALGLSLNSNNYFNDPSAIWDKGREIGGLIIDQLSWRPATYIFILLGLLTYIGFFLLAMRIIICWVEYYFLTGFSIAFLPCGVLDLGTEFYKNVFKTIMSCSIKLGVFNMWLLICDKLMKSIMTVEKKYDLDAALVVCGTVYVLVTIMISMPSITTGLLTGSPAVNAGAAMAGATAGVANTYRGAKETVKGAIQEAKTGAKGGVKTGAFVGSLAGPGGVAVGKIVGGVAGAVGGVAVGGSYSGARYAAFKEKGKSKKKNDDTDNSSSKNSSSSSSSNGGSPNQQSSPSNNSGNNGGVIATNGQTSSSNVQGSTGNVNSNIQTQGTQTTTNSNEVPMNSQPVSDTSNTTTTDTPNVNTVQTNTQSLNDVSTNTNSASNNTGTITNTSNTNSSNSTTTSSAGSVNNDSFDTGDGSGKRGIKVNGGESGKIPDWMQGDY